MTMVNAGNIKYTDILKYSLIILVSSLLFLPFLGHVNLFDWDEINFAECAREMITSKDYIRAQIDFMPFWEKPPFFIWMQVISMKIFGIGEFAARFPNAFMGVITLVSLYYIGKRTANEKMAIGWVLLYIATWLPHLYFKSGIIDPTFNFFIFLAFFQVCLLRTSEKKIPPAILAGLFLGIAVLTKGPVAILIATLSFLVYIVWNKGLNGYKIKHLAIVALFLFLPFLVWITTATIKFGSDYGKWFLNEFLTYQVRLFKTEDSDHGGPFYYHFVVLLIGCFPASIFLFQNEKKKINNEPVNDFTKWMWILFWVVLILFSIVKTKIVHYSSLCYFPLTYLAALQVYKLSEDGIKLKTYLRALMLSIGTILAILIALLPVIGLNKEKLYPYIDDPFAIGNLYANVNWSYWECLPGIVYLIGIWVAVFLMNKNFKKGMMTLCIVQVIIIQVAIIHFTPKIEAYSQRAAIDFYKGLAGQDVYIHPLGFKSYAALFYGQKHASQNQDYYDLTRKDKNGNKLLPEANEQWLLVGNIDKPAYFICKIQDEAKYKQLPQFIEVGRSNGFVFFKRKLLNSSSQKL